MNIDTPENNVPQEKRPTLMRKQVFKDLRPAALAEIAERVIRHKERTDVKNRDVPSLLHARIVRVTPEVISFVYYEDPIARRYDVGPDFIQEQLESGDWLLCEYEPCALLRYAPSQLTDAQKTAMDHNEALLKRIIPLGDEVFDDKKLSKALDDTMEDLRLEEEGDDSTNRKVSRHHIKFLVRRWVQCGFDSQGLASRTLSKAGRLAKERILTDNELRQNLKPIKVGRPRKDEQTPFLVDERTKKKIIRGAKEFFHTPEGGCWRRAWQLTCAKYFLGFSLESPDLAQRILSAKASLYPSEKTYKRWAKTDPDIIERMKDRYGYKYYNLNMRPLSSRTETDVAGPGAIVQIDPTKGDVILVHTLTRRPIGRATIYVLTDAFSHAVVGWYVSLHNAGYDVASMGLVHVATNKTERHPVLGGLFPIGFVPGMLVGDSELDSTKFARLVKDKVIKGVRIAPAYRADLKGLVEALLGSLTNTTLAHVPGHSNGVRSRGKTNPEILAVLDIEQLNQIVFCWGAQANMRTMTDYQLTDDMLKEGVAPNPLAVFNWGVKNLVGALEAPCIERLQRVCLPQDTGRIGRRGLAFAGMYYEPDGELVSDWQLKMVQAGEQKRSFPVTVTYHPEKVAKVWMHYDGRLVPMRLTEESQKRQGWSFLDIVALGNEQALLQANGKVPTEVVLALIEAEKKRITDDAKNQTEAVRGTESERAKEKVDKQAERDSEMARIEGRPQPEPKLSEIEAPRDMAQSADAVEADRLLKKLEAA